MRGLRIDVHISQDQGEADFVLGRCEAVLDVVFPRCEPVADVDGHDVLERFFDSR